MAGNGGSAADSEHITGELMKRFKTPRPIDPALAERLVSIDPVRGEALNHNLEQSLMAISQNSMNAVVVAKALDNMLEIWMCWRKNQRVSKSNNDTPFFKEKKY